MYQFVREYLWQAGGSCPREELRAAMLRHPAIRERLNGSQGFGRLLVNMRHSGDVELDGDMVTATSRSLRRGVPGQKPVS